MAFHFIHTGDWHLAKPFGGFGDKAAMLRDARSRIVDRIADLARKTGATAVLVAGDVFDGPVPGDSVVRRLALQLEQYSDIGWHFLPGNHDPAVPNGVWQRFAALATGKHIVIHHDAGVHRIGDGVDLLTAPLRSRAIAHDPTGWMSDRPSAPDVMRIGLAHGSVQGFGSGDDASVLIASDRAASAKLDYLALGDWHGVREIGPKTWYAGTPEPDQFPNNEPGYALQVSIAGPGAAPQVQRHWLAQFCWQRHMLERDFLAQLAAIEDSARGGAAPVPVGDTLMRIRLAGRVTVEEELAIRQRIERLGDLAFHVEADFSQLRVDASVLPVTGFDDPLLAAVGARLGERMVADGDDAELAHRALLLLAGYAREHGDAG